MTYAIPKRRLPATVEMLGGLHLSGVLFVDPAAPSHPGPQAVTEYLGGRPDFIPLSHGEQVLFLSRRAVVKVTVREEDDAGLAASLEPGDVPGGGAAVRLQLRDGRVVEGDVLGRMPAAYRRLSDFLNQPAWFVAVRAGGRIHLVNKRSITCAYPAAAPESKGEPWLRSINF